ncbi:hypothetical protein dsx2_0117 [Desulfovibrio sp. X2]|uniref:PIN-like domain-containing protein n=1 Tax=Desulfovibrio sp. X2 TaxID=941449 RepID=UPI000358A605|nr:PIN-like domain-containing protein [Desulfovibrio sp. X2]EPR42190.1 hypothetical protein dsx2_0117 [Desulfovibrio sp. X2]
MRTLFPGYYRYDQDEFKHLWQKALFIFDANVLLNFYSYPEDLRDIFFSVLEKVSDRIWIPYHVALEFHRNKFNKIREANLKLENLLQTIDKTSDDLSKEIRLIELEKRRIGVDNIQDRISAVHEAHKNLSEAAAKACERLPEICLNDEIGNHICELFHGRVGSPPSDQNEIERINIEGQKRYDNRIPPGHEDQKKKGDGQFHDRGIVYYRKYGDFIIWKQLLGHTATNDIKDVIFVTGDRKEDWWWIEEGKIIGPQPALVQEIMRDGKVSNFWMYTADQFLKRSEELLQIEGITDETIAQVKDFTESEKSLPKLDNESRVAINAITSSFFDAALNDLSFLNNQSGIYHIKNNILNTWKNEYQDEDAVYAWLQETHENVFRNRTFPDFIAHRNTRTIGYEVKYLRNFEKFIFPPSIINSLLRGYMEVHEGRLSEFHVIAIISADDALAIISNEMIPELRRRVSNLLTKYPADSIIVGWINGEEFIPLLF